MSSPSKSSLRRFWICRMEACMSDTDGRGFLRGGLKAALLGTGGVLLPMEGRSLFSFPNIAALPDIPVIAGGFRPSPETLELRRIDEMRRMDDPLYMLVYCVGMACTPLTADFT